MSNDPSARSFDLEFARTLSARLRGQRREPGALERSPGYIRFDGRRFVTRPTADEEGNRQQFGEQAWNRLLDGCLAATDGTTAFVMEQQGLVVATRGLASAEDAEVLGARLMLTMSHAERMQQGDNKNRAVCIEIDEGWLTGLRVAPRDDAVVTIGIVSNTPVAGDTRAVVEDLLGTMLSSLGM